MNGSIVEIRGMKLLILSHSKRTPHTIGLCLRITDSPSLQEAVLNCILDKDDNILWISSVPILVSVSALEKADGQGEVSEEVIGAILADREFRERALRSLFHFLRPHFSSREAEFLFAFSKVSAEVLSNS